MRSLIIVSTFVLCGLAPKLLSSQIAVQQIELTKQLLERENFKQALLIAQDAYRSGVKSGNIDIMTEALVLEARGLAEEGAKVDKRRIMRQVEEKLKEAYRIAERAGRDSMLQQVDLWAANLIQKPITPTIPTEGGLAATKQPSSIRDLAKEKITEFNAFNDNLNNQLGALKLEKESLEKRYQSEITALNLEQAQQQLMLARKQQAIDSISMAHMADSLLVAQAKQDLQIQETQLAQQRGRMILLWVIAGAVIAIAGVLFWLYFNSRRKNLIIEEERQRSEALLLNILPAAVAEELKANGKAPAHHYQQVTVLFTDFQNFSRTASELEPQVLVNALDKCFRAFDEIAERHGLEKIKTIGDAYMCAGGLPTPDGAHPAHVVQAGLEMQAWLKQAPEIPFQGARIGIHTGPVVAGVVGAKKFAYDIWGDTVNIASRMESEGETGRVNLSRSTFELVKGRFNCSHRGKLPAKNMGEIDMYFVEA